ncbi:hypothetical protein ISO64_14320 [Morganella morganii subsp. morganii]|nr:hypothetical protein [Morganella morganii subsp. morganii]
MSKSITKINNLSNASVKPVTKEELEAIKSPPKNRMEAKQQLAIKLRLQKIGIFDDHSVNNQIEKAKHALSVSHSLRFEQGIVDSVDTEKISDSNKRWRGKTAD